MQTPLYSIQDLFISKGDKSEKFVSNKYFEFCEDTLSGMIRVAMAPQVTRLWDFEIITPRTSWQ